ncbi:MAG: hypothetical protein GXO79_15000 [Chlorobi bacterium]|nr:hypothetical protein [Chlorobiota bacterium]
MIFPKNDDEKVLGNFGVATKQVKRIIVKNIPELSFDNVPGCDAVMLEESLRRFSWLDWPIYLVYMPGPYGGMVIGVAKSDCVDCTLKGGTTKKPDWW